MHESPRHFDSICPNCSASLRINREHVGKNVICKHCDHSFLAEESPEPIHTSREEGTASPSIQQAVQGERIVVVCPSCQATLRVRRVYVGRQVLCKQCNHTFTVSDRAKSQPELDVSDHGGTSKTSPHQPNIESGSSATQSEYDRLLTEHEQLLAAHTQLQEEDSRHAAGHARYKLKYKQVGEELSRAMTELDRIRAQLGTIAPEDVCNLVEERESLRAEVNRLSDANHLLCAERSAREHLAAELERRESELAAARAKHGLLSNHLQDALNEVDQVRTTLGERVDLMRNENDQLRAELESLREALDRADATHRVERDQLRAEHATLNDQHRQLRDQQQSTDRLCKEYQERNQELVEAQNRLESEYQLMLHSVRLQETRAAEQLDKLGFPDNQTANRDNGSRSENVNSGPPPPALVAELEAVRARVEDLQRRLEMAERINCDMFETLKLAGIRYKPVA
jgi:predicted Zn finger-like uncharacterized protein